MIRILKKSNSYELVKLWQSLGEQFISKHYIISKGCIQDIFLIWITAVTGQCLVLANNQLILNDLLS